MIDSRTMRTASLLLLTTLALGACKKTTKDEASGAPAAAEPFRADMILNVDLRYHRAEVRLVTPDKTCVEVRGDAKATLGGLPLTLKSKGGTHTAVYGHGDLQVQTNCVDPAWEIADTSALEAAPTTALDIVDGSRAAHAVFANLFAPRALRLEGTEGATLKANEKVQLIWTPPTDKIEIFALDRGKPITPAELRVHVTKTSTPGTYDLLVPPAWAGDGEAKIRMQQTIVPGLDRCDGVKSCNGVIRTILDGWRVNVEK